MLLRRLIRILLLTLQKMGFFYRLACVIFSICYERDNSGYISGWHFCYWRFNMGHDEE